MVSLIDTDVMIDLSRENADAANYLDSLSEPAISIVTAQEPIVGARDKRDLYAIDSLVSTYRVIYIDAAIGQLAYELLKRYATSDGLRTFDSLIAATAIEQDCALVSIRFPLALPRALPALRQQRGQPPIPNCWARKCQDGTIGLMADKNAPRYWLWDWLDENDIVSVDAADRALTRRTPLQQLCRTHLVSGEHFGRDHDVKRSSLG